MVRLLDEGIIASFKAQCKKKLSQWVLSQFGSSTAHHDLKKTLPNIRRTINFEFTFDVTYFHRVIDI